MRATGLLLLCAACGGGAKSMGGGGGAAGTERADISAVRSDLSVYTDGKGHYLALVEPDWEKEAPKDLTLFYGDGKTFHAAQVGNAMADGMKFEIGFQDPRIPSSPAGTVKREGGKVELSCWGKAELTKLPDADAQAMIGGATYFKNATKWSPLALSRKGDNFLYVDSEVGEGDAHRVFSGKKGAMKQIPVKSSKYDRDSNTFTFVTEKGTLLATRVENPREYTLGLAWEGKQDADWEPLGRGDNWKIIFEELGVYKARTPTPCDPVME
jgi:hypothetical protein